MEIPTYCFSNNEVILWLNRGFSILLLRRKALFIHLWSEHEHILNTLPVCYLSEKTKHTIDVWWKHRKMSNPSMDEINACRETLRECIRNPEFQGVNVKSVAIEI